MPIISPACGHDMPEEALCQVCRAEILRDLQRVIRKTDTWRGWLGEVDEVEVLEALEP
jgi:hypothetical protein